MSLSALERDRGTYPGVVGRACGMHGRRAPPHALANSLKIYDKQESVLRVETTVNDPADFRAYRAPEGKPRVPKSWKPLRKGVADLYRLTQICQGANERYLDALAEAQTDERLAQLIKPLTRPTKLKGHRVRALRPFGQDADLLQVINRGEYVLAGFRNRDIVGHLFPGSCNEPKRRQARGKVTRLLRLLRAHGLIKKVSHTHRYQVTDRGRRIIAAVLAAREASVKRLQEAA